MLSPKTERELLEQSKVFQKDKNFGQIQGMQIDFSNFDNNIEVDISANNCLDDKNQINSKESKNNNQLYLSKYYKDENDNKRRGYERERSSK